MALGPAKKAVGPQSLYDADFYRWSVEQGHALREQRATEIDWENVAEEIETLGRTERGEVASRLNVLLMHLLKWRYQPGARSNSWRATIIEQRRRLQRLLRENPSLHPYPDAILGEEHETARLRAADETRLPLDTFPSICPFTVAEILDETFYPGTAEE